MLFAHSAERFSGNAEFLISSMQAESELRFSISASADNARNMVSNVPSSRHLANRAYTDCQGPYASGNSRHCAPDDPEHPIEHSPIILSRPASLPLSFRRQQLFCAIPLFFSQFTSFISLFLHLPTICAIFIFQTGPILQAFMPKLQSMCWRI